MKNVTTLIKININYTDISISVQRSSPLQALPEITRVFTGTTVSAVQGSTSRTWCREPHSTMNTGSAGGHRLREFYFWQTKTLSYAPYKARLPQKSKSYFSFSSSAVPLSGNIEEMASKILSEGNFRGGRLSLSVSGNKKGKKDERKASLSILHFLHTTTSNKANFLRKLSTLCFTYFWHMSHVCMECRQARRTKHLKSNMGSFRCTRREKPQGLIPARLLTGSVTFLPGHLPTGVWFFFVNSRRWTTWPRPVTKTFRFFEIAVSPPSSSVLFTDELCQVSADYGLWIGPLCLRSRN